MSYRCRRLASKYNTNPKLYDIVIMSKGIEGLRLIKSIIIGSDRELGNCYLILALANPKEEIKLFTTEHRRKFYVAKAVRNEYGAIIDYEKISDYFSSFEAAAIWRLIKIRKSNITEYMFWMKQYKNSKQYN